MPKLSKSKFLYTATFFFLILLGVITAFVLYQGGGLNFGEKPSKEQIVEDSNVLDDPVSDLFGSCTHEGEPYFNIGKGEGQENFPAKVIYANNSNFEKAKEKPLVEGIKSVEVIVPEAKETSQQMYIKVIYTVDGQEVEDDVQSIRLDPCTTEEKNITQ